MSKEKIRTSPNLAETSPSHQQAMSDGTDHFRSYQYNVADHFKGLAQEDIKKTLKDTAFPYAVCMENWISDFNFSSLVRNANGFNAKEVFYLGDKKWDKRGALGTFNYTDVHFVQTIDEFVKLKDRYVFVGIDNIAGSVPLPSYSWPKNALMIFGSEGTGLTPEMQSLCKEMVNIPMFGSVRSFNAAASSAVLMYDYVSKFGK